jgi:hypothetical protein
LGCAVGSDRSGKILACKRKKKFFESISHGR